MGSAFYESHEKCRGIAHRERWKLGHLWDYVPGNVAGSTASRLQRGGVRDFGTATDQVECRRKSGLTQAFENSCLTGVSSTSWVLGDTVLDGEFARLRR